MLRFLRNLSPRVEFAVVVTVAFGYIIVGSIVVALHPHATPHHTNVSLIGLVVYEAVLMAAFFLSCEFADGRLRGSDLFRRGAIPVWA
jgi:hypothetical protein